MTTQASTALDRQSKLLKRRNEQRSRVPTPVLAMWEKVNARRLIAGLLALRPPREFRSRYPGAALRSIRARATNFKGEVQR